jgi:hypothetical protein
MKSKIKPEQYSDEVKRLAYSVTMHSLAGKAGEWAAYSLQDCTTDNITYPSQNVARRVKWPRDNYFFYIYIPPGGMEMKEAREFLRYARDLYEAGFRLPDPEVPVPTIPLTREDQVKQIKLLTK